MTATLIGVLGLPRDGVERRSRAGGGGAQRQRWAARRVFGGIRRATLSLLVASCSLLGARCSVLGARCSVLGVRCSVLGARCSVLGARCSVLCARRHGLCDGARRQRWAARRVFTTEVHRGRAQRLPPSCCELLRRDGHGDGRLGLPRDRVERLWRAARGVGAHRRARRRLAPPARPTLTRSSRPGLPGLCPDNPAGLRPDPDPLTAQRDRAGWLPLAWAIAVGRGLSNVASPHLRGAKRPANSSTIEKDLRDVSPDPFRVVTEGCRRCAANFFEETATVMGVRGCRATGWSDVAGPVVESGRIDEPGAGSLPRPGRR
jgi:hypothetical protein